MSKEGSRQRRVRREGDGIWRPSIGARITWLAMVAVLVPATFWLIGNDSELSAGRAGVYVLTALGLLITLPVFLFRWRLVLEDDEVLFVFFRVRRMPLKTI